MSFSTSINSNNRTSTTSWFQIVTTKRKIIFQPIKFPNFFSHTTKKCVNHVERKNVFFIFIRRNWTFVVVAVRDREEIMTATLAERTSGTDEESHTQQHTRICSVRNVRSVVYFSELFLPAATTNETKKFQ